ncbi:MAG: prephenate dehydratase [Gammaproteobacteria bacterium]|nr:prephenate dehydratase [Gammaproteobacteria bacterium]
MTDCRPLDQIRTDITALDRELLALLAKRRDLSIEVARSKIRDPHPVRDRQREEALLLRLIDTGRELGLEPHYVTRLFHIVIEDSVLHQQAFLQQRINPDNARDLCRVAFLGPRGSYSHLAMQQYFGRRAADLVEIDCRGFRQIVEAVENGQADYAVLPVENTSSGSINEVYDVLQHTRCAVVGELTVPVEHCLMVAVATSEAQIRTIYTHFQPAQQCSEYIATLAGVTVERCDSTAAAFLKVSELADPTVAAIGNAAGGALYGLTTLRDKIANQRENFSRFVVIGRTPVEVAEQIPAKTTLIMSTAQQPGALVEALLVLRNHGLNLTKLESRPIMGNPWEEMFYIDLEGNIAHPQVKAALDELTRTTRYLKVLGCYPSEQISPTPVAPARLASTTATPTAAASNDSGLRPVRARQLVIGGDDFVLLAGPAASLSARDGALLLPELASHGANALHSGDLDEPANALPFAELRLLGARLQLPIIGRVRTEQEVERYSREADLLLIGGAQMTHQPLLSACGATLRPVILMRDPLASLSDWLQAADIIRAAGNQQVILCEHGVRTLDRAQGITLDLAIVATLAAQQQYPLLVALPGHPTADIALPLLRAARAAGAHGALLAVGDEGLPLTALPALRS